MLGLGLLGTFADLPVALAQGAAPAPASAINYTAIGFFLFFVVITLGITCTDELGDEIERDDR